MQQKALTVNDKKFSYSTKGEGPVVMLLHGFGEDSTVWNRQYNAFDGFKLLIPDLPGSGQSEMTEDMSIEGMAKTIFDFITAIGIDRFVMIGHSMGGYITLAFTEAWPEKLNSFGLFHSTAYPDSEEKKATRQKGIEFIRKNGGYEFLKTAIPNLYSPVTKEKNPKLVEEQINASHDFQGEALIRYYQAMIDRPDRSHILKETKLPVLFVFGRYDTAVPVQDGLKQCYLPALSHVHILESSGHMGMREEEEKSTKILFDFLSD